MLDQRRNPQLLAGGSSPAAVPVMSDSGGGDSWSQVHATFANSRTLSAAGSGLEAMRRALHGDEISLSRLVASGGERWMAVIAFGGSPATEWWPLSEHPTVREVIESGIPRQIADTDPTAHPGELEVLSAGGYRSLLLLPIEFEGVELGLVEVYSHQPQRWSVADVAHARAASNQLASLLMMPSARRQETTAAVLQQL